jgi:hypothetical protein
MLGRMSSRHYEVRMPPLATELLDDCAVQLLMKAWSARL